jgi:hypothetical protein
MLLQPALAGEFLRDDDGLEVMPIVAHDVDPRARQAELDQAFDFFRSHKNQLSGHLTVLQERRGQKTRYVDRRRDERSILRDYSTSGTSGNYP